MMFLQNTGKFRPEKSEIPKNNGPPQREDTSELRLRQSLENDDIDTKYGFRRVEDHSERTGFLINMHNNEILDEDKRLISVVDYYFIKEDGCRFKVSMPFMPYFYILTRKECIQEVTQYLSKKYSGLIFKIDQILKEDLDLPNHLIGLKQRYLKLSFVNQNDLIKVRKDILSAVRKNRERAKTNTYYTEMLANALTNDNFTSRKSTNQTENIIDIREYDVPYHVRVSIDKKICCGAWYNVQVTGPNISSEPVITRRTDLLEPPDPIVLAFDIETTKLPLKFPDSATDQIMMISYMIDGQGYLIINREIISSDVDDFEYTPKPEYEGLFTVYNEPDEHNLLRRFFDHIMDVRPHVFVTYNGDFFDWPFVEARAAVYEMDMGTEIGFSKGRDGIYSCRPAMHMDCLCWVKRDSYLPVGSQNLKAVARAKLRYDPVELDPEDMCKMAVEKPQVLSNYSVSDAVATYYLYMKYVHPFIFALCTIIPMEPDEVLRKGSGTLCETLLMVEAFQVNIIFPNKEETDPTQFTSDGHLLHQETYVGGHVEALESGVFRADIPCRFKLSPETLGQLIDSVPNTLRHAIEVEEEVPLDQVINFNEVAAEIKEKLLNLQQHPNRIENPIIYHLDVGAMYPNIILTNRLQPSAIVNEEVCASCDFNRPDAVCQRKMLWTWRGEFMPATRGEYQRIQQQLETEKFPPLFPGGPQRAFHQLNKEEQAANEKKRLSDYCRKAYKKTKVVRIEERSTTVCQKENSFYVDTVRAFRDRRYEYKGLSKKAKNQVALAVKSGNAEDIKSAKSREILFDSLQLAHKCILNSFYGYVMRRGARWHSMEMAGIVCYTGANIIMKAREIIENVGRPLELDTDGIWCVLPSSFPETFKVNTNHPKKKVIEVSYPNAVLNAMVKDYFTNDQYFELEDAASLSYKKKSENSIFFEVDGPYLAMVLPASKEEGKRLKKRYAVFNFDGSLAELKGFEVKRRGELHLIKVFQSSVFSAFLKGTTLEECYASVAKVADYWLDVLYSHGVDMPDSELFELISENRSMSRKLEDYGTQKSTSITTAKRLSEFLGDQMVKDVGLACKFIISKKPDDAPVTERAVPLAIFQTESGVQRHFLRKWLKDPCPSLDIRDILDWNYYIERLGGTIQKIITIPAAMQGLPNPVPRIKHPPWLHKKMLEKNDVFKQRRISDMFTVKQKDDESVSSNLDNSAPDIEDTITDNPPRSGRPSVTVTKRKRDNSEDNNQARTWREALGPPPALGKTKEEITAWIIYQKKKWAWQAKQRRHGLPKKRLCGVNSRNKEDESSSVVRQTTSTLGGFLRRAQRTLLDTPWQIIQILETKDPGVFKVWALVGQELHQIRLTVPRIFYVNQRMVRNNETGDLFKKCNRILPRAQPVYNLYEYSVPEPVFLEHNKSLMANLTTPGIEGIYETQMSLEFRAILQVGCVCGVRRDLLRDLKDTANTFSLDQLQIRSMAQQPYLKENADGVKPIKHLYLYHHCSPTDQRAIYSLFLSPSQRALVIVFDTVRTNQVPNLNSMYKAERIVKLQNGASEESLPPPDITFEVRVEVDIKQVHRLLQRALQTYIDEKRGPSLLAIQSPIDISTLILQMPSLADIPLVPVHVQDVESLFNTLEWQRIGVRAMIRHYLNSDIVLELSKQQCRYLYVPLGNLPADPTIFGADIYYARYLQKNNFILWCSPTSKPDLGGREADDNRLLIEFEERSSAVTNIPGCYSSICVELDIDGLAVNTLLQSHKVHEIEGTSTSTAFDTIPQASLDDMVGAVAPLVPLPSYDETALCSAAFKVLKSMVNSWLRDISVHRNVFADFQVVHFYRWLRSPQALLYDPALRRTLHALMKKLFIQLIAEFKRLGSIVIYANFDKIVICTKKRTVGEAISYVEYIVQNIRNKELFHSIEISYNQCWEYLMWLNLANHGGVSGKLPKGLTTVGESEDNSEVANTENSAVNSQESCDDEAPEIVMNWNLTEILPEEGSIRANFNAIVAGYISAIHSQLIDFQTGTNTPVPRRPLSSQSLTQSAPLGLGAHTSVVVFARELITGEMSQKLFSLVQKINKRWPEYAAPELAYKGQKTIKPALEFVKAICCVLSLDSGIETEIMSLRRNMLRLLSIGEFNDIANWSEPFISFVLPEIICKACNHCRDIDLCKDKYRSIENDIPVWLCPLCNTAYDSTEIEYQLIDALNRKAMAYMLQDLQCKKCTQIKMENMTLFCNCAGKFQTLITSEDITTHINTFLAIARTFKMSLLCEVVEWVKEMNS